MNWFTSCALIAAVSAASPALALPAGSFDPRAYHAQVQGELTEILVLGTPHLSGAPDSFDPEALEPLLAKLAAFRPDVIAIENLSGESIDHLRRFEAAYPGVAALYAPRTLEIAAIAREATGLDMPAAEAEARRALDDLGDAPTPAQRRRLAALFMSAADPNSALVQWQRLSPEAQTANADFPEPLAQAIESFGRRRNETVMIAARLATRLGLERLYPMDDHSSDDIVLPLEEAFEVAMKIYPDLYDDPDLRRLATAQERLRTGEEALATYRDLNGREAGLADSDGQWLVLLNRAFPKDAGRARMAAWETRNLRMAAHIREAAAAAPGGRVLVIVGSAHKAYLDAYLDMMTDVRIVDADAVLR